MGRARMYPADIRFRLRVTRPGAEESAADIRIRLRVKGPGAEESAAVIRFRLRVKGPGAEESAPYAGPPIRRVRRVVIAAIRCRWDYDRGIDGMGPGLSIQSYGRRSPVRRCRFCCH